MKKFLTMAVVATLFLAGSVFAVDRHLVAEPNATFAFGSFVGGIAVAQGPSTTNNDDSCDISTAPAATLLLPYFEVDTAARGIDTFFTVTNTSNLPQIAHVVVWTDWTVPVLDFNIFLTGYDVQSISMYDIIVNGIIAPTNAQLTAGGTSSNTTPGSVSLANTANPNITDLSRCGSLPGFLPGPLRTALAAALTTGSGTGYGCVATRAVGANHGATTAIGYVTIDVANNCSLSLPTDSTYFTNEILFDNVLTGDYQFINKNTGNNYLGANPLVHIRAVPEGGPAGLLTSFQTNLPYTFYSRFANRGTVDTLQELNPDRRQPLPSVFAARYIQGGVNAQNTNYKVWREGPSGPVDCASTQAPILNSSIPVTEIVRFDAHENPMTYTPGVVISPPIGAPVLFPETSRSSTSNTTLYPPMVSPAGDDNGWMYMNLNSGTTAPTGALNLNTALHPGMVRASQNWVVVELTGGGSTAGLFGGEFDATWLGNGCSGAVSATATNTAGIMGPVGGTPVCPAGANCTAITPANTVATGGIDGTYTNNGNGATIGQAGLNTTP